MTPMLILYSITLTLIFQSETFSCYAFVINKFAKTVISSADLLQLIWPHRRVALFNSVSKEVIHLEHSSLINVLPCWLEIVIVDYVINEW